MMCSFCMYHVLFDLLANRYLVAVSLNVCLKEKTSFCPMFSSLYYTSLTMCEFDS